MAAPRLSTAIAEGLVWPEDGTILAIGPRAPSEIADLPKDRVHVVQGHFPAYTQFDAAGFSVTPNPPDAASAALISLPRAKALARHWVAQAAMATGGGLIVVDGQKTDGIDSLLKDIKRRTPILGSLSKAHGRLFWFEEGDFGDWLAGPRITPQGHVTVPGGFSADGIDPATAALAAALPRSLGAKVADLGAGWGALSLAVLDREGVQSLDLIEADYHALQAARQNIDDPRATFHWADALIFQAPDAYDAIVSNPPFHTGRAAEPTLGQAFIATAARLLAPRGQLWLVANRHLPYEAALTEHFHEATEIAGTPSFKILVGRKPRKPNVRG